MSGFGQTSSKRIAFSRCASVASARPAATTPLSVTRSGRVTPSSATSSPTRAIAPAPWTIRVGTSTLRTVSTSTLTGRRAYRNTAAADRSGGQTKRLGVDRPKRSVESASELLTEPLLDLRLVRRDPLLRGLVGIQVVAGDHLGDRVLVLVRPAPTLDDRDSGGAARRELLAEELEQRVARVRARVRLWIASVLLVVLATLETGRELDHVDLVLCVEVLRVVPVEEDGLLLLVELCPARHLGRLRADADELEVQSQRLDQRLVLLLIRRVAAEEHALRARLRALEERLLALQAFPRLELRMLLHQVVRDVPPDRALHPIRSDPDYGLLLRHVLLPLRDVAPVLEDPVRFPVRHRLVDGNLGDLRDLDLATEGFLEDVLDHVRVCGRPRPRLLVQRDGAALGRFRSRTPGAERHHRERCEDQPSDTDLHSSSFSLPHVFELHDSPSIRLRVLPCVTRSSAVPSARIASEARTPCPNRLCWSPWATTSPKGSSRACLDRATS